jgi:N-acyl-D-amino-acid deacylase
MLLRSLIPTLCLAAATPTAGAADVLLRGATVYDGSGAPGRVADVRIHGSHIAAIGSPLEPRKGEVVREVKGLALAPGFIDMHSHGDHGLLEDRDAGAVTRQGATTILVGQDGDAPFPLADWYAKLEKTPVAINVASMAGHATLRAQAMGKDLYRPSTAAELATMQRLLGQELRSGAFGLSTGLEYEAAHFSTTEEVIELSKVAARAHGFYISHVRDEADGVFDAFAELVRIGREAHLPVEITHIKLSSPPHWHEAAARMPAVFAEAKREGVTLWADVYPYTYWHSTIRVIVPDRDFFNPAKVEAAFVANGGPAAIRLAHYAPDPSVAGKNLAEIAAIWKITPVEAYMRIVRATEAEVGSEQSLEDVIGTSMVEDDVRWFVAHPDIAFCTDGELHGAHPRGAGTFPRILGRYVREQHALTLESAIHKMSGIPAARLGLKDRGRIAPGAVADLVLFDPATVLDQATVEHPDTPPIGIPAVMVHGEWVVDGGQVTGRHPGRVLRHASAPH